ncbi:MAG: hypothetical protein ACI9LY_000127 [Arenicella sp.]|jgi:hypothetical protein
MKIITHILTLTILMLFASPMLAAQNEMPTEKPRARQMEKMHSHMQMMQQQMKEINATKDPKKRKALMQQNMQSMRKGMMMGEMDDTPDKMVTDDARGRMTMGKMDEAQSKMAHPAMQEKKQRMACQQDDAQCQRMQAMEHRQKGMQERMKMMKMMMQQMMEHQSAQADQP